MVALDELRDHNRFVSAFDLASLDNFSIDEQLTWIIPEVRDTYQEPEPNPIPGPRLIRDPRPMPDPRSLADAKVVKGTGNEPTGHNRIVLPARLSTLDNLPIYEQLTWIIPAVRDKGQKTGAVRKATSVESYVSQIRGLIKHSGIYALSSGAAPLISLVLAPFLTHHCLSIRKDKSCCEECCPASRVRRWRRGMVWKSKPRWHEYAENTSR